MTVKTIIAEDPQNAFKHKMMTEIIKDKELEEPEVAPTAKESEKAAQE